MLKGVRVCDVDKTSQIPELEGDDPSSARRYMAIF
jgi:hypothetical protein